MSLARSPPSEFLLTPKFKAVCTDGNQLLAVGGSGFLCAESTHKMTTQRLAWPEGSRCVTAGLFILHYPSMVGGNNICQQNGLITH